MCAEKQALRVRAREIRAAIPPGKRAELSRAIMDRLLGLLDGADPVLVYVSKPPEVDTAPLISAMLTRGTGVVVPIIEREQRSLRLSYLRDPSLLSVSTFSVPEPIGHEIPAEPREIAVVIVPMIAYDARGHRLGYGAGYYDRFLSRHPHIQKIGVAFSCQEVESIPADENDVSMDFIVTESGVTRVPG
ncbi:MAG: 5-formyltetrahydrofolate cyclo-ligase [Methanolinea sp.]|jgi:5-formyltetrahydrofolate cyclo-ligase|nr:5-formyltetrahydrofolate cyclo-ligase [Methanolinea sp.]